ncbi:hypothetical protein BC826DRAFT_119893 [Russula brevipes]|nr:hypothetical protein BC826DRAFT_119893 [Russula brevipes]
MPLHEATLESDRVKLTPFIPSLHAKEYADCGADHRPSRTPPLVPIQFKLSNIDEILTTVELYMRRDPTWILFTIIDKARGGVHAGLIGLINASPEKLSAEIAWAVVFGTRSRRLGE